MDKKKQKKTQLSEILKYLLRYKKGLTRGEAWDKFGCQNLPDVIWKLRKRGYDIRTEQLTTVNRYGHTSTYVRYYLVA